MGEDCDSSIFPPNQAPSPVSGGRMTLKRNTNYQSSRTVKTKRDNCMPTTGADKLDDNLLREILIRAPAKTVVRLKVMNTRWHSLISDPFFLNKHTSRQTNRDACSFFSDCSTDESIVQRTFSRSSPFLLNKTTISLDLPFAFTMDRAEILASYHGILLIMLREHNYICIYNPLTKKKQLTPSPLKQTTCHFGLVFGPTSSSPYYYNHYSVVCLVLAKTMIKFKIFNPEKGRWRDSKKTTRINYTDWVCIHSPPVCFRGIIHWLTREGHIIAFNSDKEESRIIEIPKNVSEMVFIRFTPIETHTLLGVVEDELNIVVVTPEHEIVIWVLDDYENNKWISKRKHVIKTERNHTVYMQPIFFDGERLILYVCTSARAGKWNSDWQEHNILTSVSRILCSADDPSCFPHIGTLTEILGQQPKNPYYESWDEIY